MNPNDYRFEVVLIQDGKMHQLLLSETQKLLLYELLNSEESIRVLDNPICGVY